MYLWVERWRNTLCFNVRPKKFDLEQDTVVCLLFSTMSIVYNIWDLCVERYFESYFSVRNESGNRKINKSTYPLNVFIKCKRVTLSYFSNLKSWPSPCNFFSVSQNFCSSVKYLSKMNTLDSPSVAMPRSSVTCLSLDTHSLTESPER